jgi:uracil-DNA glycosylase
MTLEELKEAASCSRCDLYQRAAATEFGEGLRHPPLALVGEQPGDQEDKHGHPFVGAEPAICWTVRCVTAASGPTLTSPTR